MVVPVFPEFKPSRRENVAPSVAGCGAAPAADRLVLPGRGKKAFLPLTAIAIRRRRSFSKRRRCNVEIRERFGPPGERRGNVTFYL